MGHLAEIDRHGRGLEPPLARVALALKTSGAVGLAPGGDGRFYVLRATTVRLEEQPWNAALAARVRELLRRSEREALLERLVEGLRTRSSIELEAGALAALEVPGPEEFPALLARQ